VIAPPPDVRRAGRGDLDGVSGALARAFHDDPVMAWMFPDGAERVRLNERFFRLRVRGLLGQDEVYTTNEYAGAAVWTLPDRWRMRTLESLALALRILPVIRHRAALLARGWAMVEDAHPRDPHYYLAILGTEPDLQGRGIGSALMKPVLDGCDRDEIPAYLESSKEQNIAFYARHGFRVTGELEMPEGPTVWKMWRDPRP
jgi:ribosomal protein S18 acetylase RimI-like enzyme